MKGSCLFILILAGIDKCYSQGFPIFGFPQTQGNNNPVTQNPLNFLNPINGLLPQPTTSRPIQDGTFANSAATRNPTMTGAPSIGTIPSGNNPRVPNPFNLLSSVNNSVPSNTPNSVPPIIPLNGGNTLGSMVSQGATNNILGGPNRSNILGTATSQSTFNSPVSNPFAAMFSSNRTNSLSSTTSPFAAFSPFSANNPFRAIMTMFSFVMLSPFISTFLAFMFPFIATFLFLASPLIIFFSIFIFPFMLPFLAMVPLMTRNPLTATSTRNRTNPVSSTAGAFPFFNPTAFRSVNISPSFSGNSTNINRFLDSTAFRTGNVSPQSSTASPAQTSPSSNPLLGLFPVLNPSANASSTSNLPFSNTLEMFWRPFRTASTAEANGSADLVRLAFAPILGTWDATFALLRSGGWPFVDLMETLWRPCRLALELGVNATSNAFRLTFAPILGAWGGADELVRSFGLPFTDSLEAAWRPVRSAIDSGVNGAPDLFRIAFSPILGSLDGITELSRSLGWPLGTVAQAAWVPVRAELTAAAPDPVRLTFAPVLGIWNGTMDLFQSSSLPVRDALIAAWRPLRVGLAANGSSDAFRVFFAPILGFSDGVSRLLRSSGWPISTIIEAMWRPLRIAFESSVNDTLDAFALSFTPISTTNVQDAPVPSRPR